MKKKRLDIIFIILGSINLLASVIVYVKLMSKLVEKADAKLFNLILSMAWVLASLFFIAYVLIRQFNKVTKNMRYLSGILNMAEIYVSMHLIDLNSLKIHEVKSNEHINSCIDKEHQNAAQQITTVMKEMATDEYRKDIVSFVDLSTLAERMRGVKSISQEFIGKYSGWCRARFVAIGDDLENITQVIYAVEIIEDEKKRVQELIELSERDSMTGIYNRGTGEKYIAEYLFQKKEGMMLLLDVDHFKSINDTYGHDIGDQVIKAIANCLSNTFRERDVVIRFGGDEFGVFVLGITDENIGNDTVNRLFHAINQIKIKELDGKKIEVSVGAYLYDGKTRENFEDLYKRVDKTLYISKKVEGNYCTFYFGN